MDEQEPSEASHRADCPRVASASRDPSPSCEEEIEHPKRPRLVAQGACPLRGTSLVVVLRAKGFEQRARLRAAVGRGPRASLACPPDLSDPTGSGAAW